MVNSISDLFCILQVHGTQNRFLYEAAAVWRLFDRWGSCVDLTVAPDCTTCDRSVHDPTKSCVHYTKKQRRTWGHRAALIGWDSMKSPSRVSCPGKLAVSLAGCNWLGVSLEWLIVSQEENYRISGCQCKLCVFRDISHTWLT